MQAALFSLWRPVLRDRVPVRLYAVSDGAKEGGVPRRVVAGDLGGLARRRSLPGRSAGDARLAFGKTDAVFGHVSGFTSTGCRSAPVDHGATWAMVVEHGRDGGRALRRDVPERRVRREDATFWAKASLFFPPYMKWLWDVEGAVVASFCSCALRAVQGQRVGRRSRRRAICRHRRALLDAQLHLHQYRDRAARCAIC